MACSLCSGTLLDTEEVTKKQTKGEGVNGMSDVLCIQECPKILPVSYGWFHQVVWNKVVFFLLQFSGSFSIVVHFH